MIWAKWRPASQAMPGIDDGLIANNHPGPIFRKTGTAGKREAAHQFS
jgi:hypothetical protein